MSVAYDQGLVFSAIGGSATHWLIDTLARRFTVAAKPDNIFRRFYHTLCPTGVRCIHSDAGRSLLEERHGSEIASQFRERSGGYLWANGIDLESGLADFASWITSDVSRAWVSGTCSELGLFAKLRIPNVVFVVRDPEQVLLSWSKPYRHGDIVQQLGGLNSLSTIDYIATRWNRHVAEALTMERLGLLGGIIRFDCGREDAASLGLGHLFSTFDSTISNSPASLSDASRLHLQARTNSLRKILDDVTSR